MPLAILLFRSARLGARPATPPVIEPLAAVIGAATVVVVVVVVTVLNVMVTGPHVITAGIGTVNVI